MAMGWKLDALCNDAVFYIELAENLEQGNLEDGFGRLGLNTYPPVLAACHHFSHDWEHAGKAWGIFIASLAVLPLYGWVRRQFDGRTALVAALLYAFHPKLIEWSPELLRDPTFWFLALLALYASWRAAAESRLAWYAAAGLTIALAAHTRFEGWMLYLPVMVWSLFRAHARLRRSQIAGRLALCGAVSPLVVLLVNTTVLHDQARWQLGNFERLQYVALWFRETWAAPNQQAAKMLDHDETQANQTTVSQSLVTDRERMSPGRMSWIYVNTFRRGFGALFGMAWLVGFAVAPKRWLQSDHAVLFMFAACVAAAAWVHFWYAQATSSRYFLTIVLVAFPCAATGWLWVYDRAVGLVGRLSDGPWARIGTASIALLATLVVGMGESLADRHDGRSREAALGRWLLAELGPAAHIATLKPMPLIGYYAHATTHVIAAGDLVSTKAQGDETIDALVAVRRQGDRLDSDKFSATALRYGLQPIDAGRLPAGHDWSDVVVLARGKAHLHAYSRALSWHARGERLSLSTTGGANERKERP